jgi:Helix-turn-helix domain
MTQTDSPLLSDADDRAIRPVLRLARASGLDVGRLIDVIRALVVDAIEQHLFDRVPDTASLAASVGMRTNGRPTERPSMVARRLGVATRTVQGWIKDGVKLADGRVAKLTAATIGRRYYVARRDLNEFLSATNAAPTI